MVEKKPTPHEIQREYLDLEIPELFERIYGTKLLPREGVHIRKVIEELYPGFGGTFPMGVEAIYKAFHDLYGVRLKDLREELLDDKNKMSERIEELRKNQESDLRL